MRGHSGVQSMAGVWIRVPDSGSADRQAQHHGQQLPRAVALKLTGHPHSAGKVHPMKMGLKAAIMQHLLQVFMQTAGGFWMRFILSMESMEKIRIRKI